MSVVNVFIRTPVSGTLKRILSLYECGSQSKLSIGINFIRTSTSKSVSRSTINIMTFTVTFLNNLKIHRYLVGQLSFINSGKCPN